MHDCFLCFICDAVCCLSSALSIDSIFLLNFHPGGNSGVGQDIGFSQLGKPDDVDVSIELKDWLFALEGRQEMAERWWFHDHENMDREERCWHTTFRSLQVKAKSNPKDALNGKGGLHAMPRYPVESITVRINKT